jgi:CDP-diacylglycerol--glycerol-3-phosphate 3-phosphatidyltransferase
MPTIYVLKPGFQNLLRPLANGLARIGVTANQITLAAALLSLGAESMIALARGGRMLLLALTMVNRARHELREVSANAGVK